MPETKYHIGVGPHKTVAQVCVPDAKGEILAERRYLLSDRPEGRR